jgi:hypothetical protein
VRPTVTPVPFAAIQSINVTDEQNNTITLNPGGKIILTPGANVVIKVNVITNTDLNALIFGWEFCHPEKNTKGQAAVQIPYQLSEDGEDCITVKIEGGGTFLDTAHFFISSE